MRNFVTSLRNRQPQLGGRGYRKTKMQITGDGQRYGPATTASWREALLQVSVGCDDGDLRGTDDIKFPLGRDKSSFSLQVLDNGDRYSPQLPS